jgi:molybdopterin molybdotransferase
MIAVREGQEHILAQVAGPVPPEVLAVPRALARVLAAPVQAPLDVPPADNSAVDGYAVGSGDIPSTGTRDLEVVGDLAAGAVFSGALRSGQALRIMTGAPLPAGADTVYPQEHVERVGARVRIASSAKGVNVRLRGEDVEAGGIVIEAGTVQRPQEIGLITSLGLWQVSVHRRPRVALLSTGDEVAEPGTPRKPGQIYDANRFTLRGSIEQAGGQVLDLGVVPDVRETLRAQLLEASAMADFVVTSGGVSVGVYDLVKEVLGEIGTIDFWQVAMQPGRPLAFGRIGLVPDLPVLRIVSAGNVAGEGAKMALLSIRERTGATTRTTERLPRRPGGASSSAGPELPRRAWEVRSTGCKASGILSSMVAGNCLIVLEEDRGDVAPGELVLVEPFAEPL